jgi:protein SFI1
LDGEHCITTYLACHACSLHSYDFALVAEIIELAEHQAAQAARQGKGTGEVTLQRLLLAYEAVLPRHNVKPEEDIYYYR